MIISFEQSGGFGNLMRGCEIDTDKLPTADAAALHSLVDQSQIAQSVVRHSPHARDATQYDIVIKNGAAVHRVSVDDTTVPPEVRPLLRFLQSQSKPRTVS